MSSASIVASIILLVAAIILRFAMQGYSLLAYVCVYAILLILIINLAPVAARRIALAITLVGALAIAITEVPIIRASSGSSDGTQSYLVVLGAKVNGTEPSLSLLYRLEGALAYLQKNPDAVCVASGGQGPDEGISEAQCMSNWLQAHGIEQERIILEATSSSTDENIAKSYKLIIEHAGKPKDCGYKILAGDVAIASSGYHLYRAQLKAEKFGFTPATVSCYSGNALLAINYYLREAFAVWAQKAFG